MLLESTRQVLLALRPGQFKALPASNESDISAVVGKAESGKGRMSFDIPPRSRPLCLKMKITTDVAGSRLQGEADFSQEYYGPNLVNGRPGFLLDCARLPHT